MKKLSEKAFAKLNISLDVLAKRQDGYHDMRMIMQSAALYDDVSVELTDSGGARARTNLSYLPQDRRNIAVKAAELFLEKTGREDIGADISIVKRIPVGAGLGGGSSDAAAVLRAMNTLCNTGYSRLALEEMARELGSDVPFCVAGGTVLAQGRGEIMTDLRAFPDCVFVICKPAFSISTPELFSRMDCQSLRCHPDTDGILDGINAGELVKITRRMYNVFEDLLPRQYGDIFAIKSRLLDYGAAGVVMSGTGSAVFGVFDNDLSAASAFDRMKPHVSSRFMAKPLPRLDI